LVVNKGLFTNGYKKLQKLAQNVIPKGSRGGIK
jgi:hypothetical protein